MGAMLNISLITVSQLLHQLLPEKPLKVDAQKQPSYLFALPLEKPTQHALLKKLSAVRQKSLLLKMLTPYAQLLLPSAKPLVPLQHHALQPKSNALLSFKN